MDTEKVSHLLDEDVQGVDETAYRIRDRGTGLKAGTNETVGCPSRPVKSEVESSLCYVYALVKVLVLAALNSQQAVDVAKGNRVGPLAYTKGKRKRSRDLSLVHCFVSRHSFGHQLYQNFRD
jgi:hypothetical protein